MVKHRSSKQLCILTHHHIFSHPIHVRLVPGRKCVNGNIIGLKFTVWIGENTLQSRDEFS